MPAYPYCRYQGPLRAFLLLTLAVVLPGLALAGDDTTPPELKSLRFTPAIVDTSAGTAEVTLSYAVTDDASGVNYFEATFVDASGAFRQSASAKFAPTLAATNSVKVSFPQFCNSGTWTLNHVFLSDAAGNTLILDEDGLSGRGLPTRLEVKSVRDTVSPRLTALEFSPAQIDTSTGPVDVKVNYTATDDLSGVVYIELSFVGPSGVARQGGSARFRAVLSESNSITATFPPHSEPGEWTLSHVFLADAAGNTLVLDKDGVTQLGFRTALGVKSASDTTPPRLTDFRFAPEGIDTSRGPGTVKVDFTATDDLSGVNYLELSFVSPAGNVRYGGSAKFDPAQSVSKSIAVTFPQLCEAGQWTLNSVFLSDAAGNTQILNAEGLAGLGFRTALQVTSAADTRSPELASVRFSPEVIDTSQGEAIVTVEFQASDDFTGVKSFDAVFTSPSGLIGPKGSAVYSPARKEVVDSVKIRFPKSSEPGTWTLSTLMLSDEAGNTLVLSPDVLASKVGVLHVR
jgi:Bacterial Ig-like domain